MALTRIQPREAPTVEISRRLLDYLLSGDIRAGERIPSERQLAETLGVGRSAVRDALRPLLMLGILEARQGDGTYLKGAESRLLPQALEWGLLLGEHSALQLVEARIHIEIGLARLAAVRRTDAGLSQLRERLSAMESAQDQDSFVEADVAFHLEIANASGNAVLAGVLASIQTLLRVWIARVIMAEASLRPSYVEHEPIFDAIRRGDESAAAAAAEAHLRAAAERLRQTLGAPTASGTLGPKDPPRAD